MCWQSCPWAHASKPKPNKRNTHTSVTWSHKIKLLFLKKGFVQSLWWQFPLKEEDASTLSPSSHLLGIQINLTSTIQHSQHFLTSSYSLVGALCSLMNHALKLQMWCFAKYLKCWLIPQTANMHTETNVLTWASFLVCIQYVSHMTLADIWVSIVDTNVLAIMSLGAYIRSWEENTSISDLTEHYQSRSP